PRSKEAPALSRLLFPGESNLAPPKGRAASGGAPSHPAELLGEVGAAVVVLAEETDKTATREPQHAVPVAGQSEPLAESMDGHASIAEVRSHAPRNLRRPVLRRVVSDEHLDIGAAHRQQRAQPRRQKGR